MYNVQDCINQYGAAMSKPLPEKDFQWCTDKWCTETDMDKVTASIMQIDPEATTGHFWEVSLHTTTTTTTNSLPILI